MHKTIPKMIAILFTVMVLAVPALAQGTDTKTGVGARFVRQVTAISTGADNNARRAAITRRLDQLRIKYRVEAFVFAGREGKNIIADLPAARSRKQLMLGAHYDRVSAGKGAVDNASGVAAVLELLAAFKKKPLKNYRASASFFDLEEMYLRGSAEYLKSREGKNLPAIFLNFDVFGYGDALWVGAKDAGKGAALAVTESAAASSFPLQIGPEYPPSDHLSFVDAGVESLSFSLIDAKEIKGILLFFNHGRPDPMPRVLTIIHSENDTPDKIDGAAVARSLPVVEQAIRLMDK